MALLLLETSPARDDDIILELVFHHGGMYLGRGTRGSQGGLDTPGPAP